MKVILLQAALVLLQSLSFIAAEPLKVYILAGQSNMVGLGQVEGKETPGTVDYCIENDKDGKYEFLVGKRRGKIAEQEDVWIYYERDGDLLKGNLTTGYGNKNNSIGLELSFGEQIQKQEDGKILLIKVAWGGKSLAKDFRPPSAGGETGHYYHELLRCVDDALSNLNKHFPKSIKYDGYKIMGFCWHQGWNDHVSKTFTAEYTKNLEHLIDDLRKEWKSDFPVVVATTGMATKRDAVNDNKPKHKPIEKAQLAIAKVKKFKGNVAVVDTIKFWKSSKDSPAPKGNQHYHWNKSAEIYMDIGFACAEAFEDLKK